MLREARFTVPTDIWEGIDPDGSLHLDGLDWSLYDEDGRLNDFGSSTNLSHSPVDRGERFVVTYDIDVPEEPGNYELYIEIMRAYSYTEIIEKSDEEHEPEDYFTLDGKVSVPIRSAEYGVFPIPWDLYQDNEQVQHGYVGQVIYMDEDATGGDTVTVPMTLVLPERLKGPDVTDLRRLFIFQVDEGGSIIDLVPVLQLRGEEGDEDVLPSNPHVGDIVRIRTDAGELDLLDPIGFVDETGETLTSIEPGDYFEWEADQRWHRATPAEGDIRYQIASDPTGDLSEHTVATGVPNANTDWEGFQYVRSNGSWRSSIIDLIIEDADERTDFLVSLTDIIRANRLQSGDGGSRHEWYILPAGTYKANKAVLDLDIGAGRSPRLEPCSLLIGGASGYTDHRIFHTNPSILSAARDLRTYVDRLNRRLRLDSLQFADSDYLLWLMLGRDRLNAITPVTAFTMTAATGPIRQYWLMAAQVEALRTRYLEEALTQYDYSGAGVNLTVDITQFLESQAQVLETRLEQATQMKTIMAMRGLVSGSGRWSLRNKNTGVIGLTLGPVTGHRRRGAISRRLL